MQAESVLVDGHVHIHGCFDLRTLFYAAQQNFCSAARTLGIAGEFRTVLLLTESHDANYFSKLREIATDGAVVESWHLGLTPEPESIIATGPDGFELTIIAGRQIVTSEKLEVLATCTDQFFDDGGTISEVIGSVSAAGGIAIVPWGFGKWTGGRKKVVNRLIDEFPERPFHLGDNSGRISAWQEPSQFGRARSQGQRVFRGSDPMPFPGQETRIGSFGFHVEGPFSKSRPTASMRSLLVLGNTQPASYGALEHPMTFVKHQLMMQVQKWRRNFTPIPT